MLIEAQTYKTAALAFDSVLGTRYLLFTQHSALGTQHYLLYISYEFSDIRLTELHYLKDITSSNEIERVCGGCKMTTVVRWNPVREMAAMQNALDQLFENNWRGTHNSADIGALALDVHETDQNYTVSAAVPGVSADAVNISFHDSVLTISGEIPQATQENARALMLERGYGKFQRSIRLPQPVDTSAVEANIENGVLTLTLPKTPEAQPRQIPVKTVFHSNN